MKVLLWGSKEFPFGYNVGDKYPVGGIEKKVNSLANYFSEQDIKATVITRNYKSGSNKPKEKSNIEVLRVPWIRGRFFRMPSYNLSSFFKLLFSKNKYDVIYTFGIFASFLGFIISKLKNSTHFISPCGISFSQEQYFPFNKLLYLIEKFTYSKDSLMIYSSNNEKQMLESRLNYCSKNYIIIPDGVSLNKTNINFINKLKLRFGKKQNILVVSRLSKVKNVDKIIKAMKGIDANLIILGNGEELNSLKELTINLNLTKKVFFEGFVSNVQDYLVVSDVYILFSDSEGLPNSLLEAMASNVCCIISNLDVPFKNNTELIKIESNSISDLNKNIAFILRNDTIRQTISKNARKRIDLDYSWNNIIKIYLKLFSKKELRKVI